MNKVLGLKGKKQKEKKGKFKKKTLIFLCQLKQKGEKKVFAFVVTF